MVEESSKLVKELQMLEKYMKKNNVGYNNIQQWAESLIDKIKVIQKNHNEESTASKETLDEDISL